MYFLYFSNYGYVKFQFAVYENLRTKIGQRRARGPRRTIRAEVPSPAAARAELAGPAGLPARARAPRPRQARVRGLWDAPKLDSGAFDDVTALRCRTGEGVVVDLWSIL